ncbi:alpha/beta hydrolase [Pseudolysinimonas sp.]|uniref:alpha/beta hydrolase n=1 Tax=Pseudolysinimonas sp. TaxID=2680009 RepID=UPI003F7CF196
MSADDHVIVLPGGGYARHAPHEAEPVAAWLEGLGVAASVFRYPVSTRHPGPLEAVRGAVREARANGAQRVALLGFSAGGHAAGMAALAPGAAPDERVDAAILAYPVVSMTLPTHAGSRRELLGEGPTETERRATSLEHLVTADAPPFFVWHTAEDAAVRVEHAYLLAQALAAVDAPHELHVFSTGPHGLGLAAEASGARMWPALCAEWLRRAGWIA